ncbi:FAD/NAD-P-binding domain-containing protein [Trametes elegans]|nr:FAD/NAD-P-binding domain-containing protein [Trametes elegans]
MSLPSDAEVLIVGAGPTGLCLALALWKQGFTDIVVVDGAVQGESTSRAIVLHAATLEALDAIDCAKQVAQACRKASGTVIRSRGISGIEIASFPTLAKYTKFPFLTVIPQHITEKVIEDMARERGTQVFRPHKVVSLRPSSTDPKSTEAVFDDGHVLRARCVVGADGSRSTVRENARIGWADPDGEADDDGKLFSKMVMADVTLENPPPWPADKLNLAVSDGNLCLFVRLPPAPYPHLDPQEPVYRIGVGIPKSFGEPPHAPDTAYLQQLVDAWGPNVVLGPAAPRVLITHTAWASRFRTRSSIADTFFTYLPAGTGAGADDGGAPARAGGPVLLLGDAAHIHPPMGGQGMNLGIRDAVRLAPVLAAYVHGGAADDGPLRAWAVERHARAKTVIQTVKGLQRLLAAPDRTRWVLGVFPLNPTWIRNTFLRFVCMFTWWRAKGAWQVSGLGNP